MRLIVKSLFTVWLLLFSFATVSASAADSPLAPADARQMLQAHGIGKMVKLTQSDGTHTRAKIVAIGDTTVTLRDGSKPSFEVPYSTLTRVEGGGLPRIAKITIVVVIVFIALGIVGTRV